MRGVNNSNNSKWPRNPLPTFLKRIEEEWEQNLSENFSNSKDIKDQTHLRKILSILPSNSGHEQPIPHNWTKCKIDEDIYRKCLCVVFSGTVNQTSHYIISILKWLFKNTFLRSMKLQYFCFSKQEKQNRLKLLLRLLNGFLMKFYLYLLFFNNLINVSLQHVDSYGTIYGMFSRNLLRHMFL